MIRRPPPPIEERCKRTRCIRRAVKDGICLAHLKKVGKSRYGVARMKDSTGREYQSKAERDGMADFRLREKAGEISELHEQVTFSFCIDTDGGAFIRCNRLGFNMGDPGVLIESYRADVVWCESGVPGYRVGDFKRGLITDDFRRKARWMAACGWPVEILKR